MIPNSILGVGEAPLEPCDLADEEVKLVVHEALPAATDTDMSTVRAHAASQGARVDAPAAKQQEDGEPPSHLPDEAVSSDSPEEMMVFFNEAQFNVRVLLVCVRSVLSVHMRDVKVDLDASAWNPEDTDALSEIMCELSHRFSARKTDLALCYVDPFQLVLNPGTRPIKQHAYRRNPAISAKAPEEIDKLIAAGILRRLYSSWASTIVAIVKKGKSIRITANYKRPNNCTAVPVFPVPLIEDLLHRLG